MANQKLIAALVGLGDFVGDAAGEGLEEYLQSIITPVLQNQLLGANNEITLISPEQLEAAFSAVFNGISALTGNNSLIETVNTENIVSDKQKNTAVSEDSSDAISEISTGSPVDVNLNKTMSGIKKKLSDLFVENLLNRFNLDRRKIGDYVYVQRNVFDTLLKEGFFTDKQLRNRVDINEESGMVIETNKSSIDETFNLDNYARLGSFKKKAKLATIIEIPKAIQEGHLITDNTQNSHKGSAVNKNFAYIEYFTNVDGVDIKLKLAIKKSPQKNKFWVHSVYDIENVNGYPASTTSGTEAGYRTIDSGIISQTNRKNNTSAKNSAENISTNTVNTSVDTKNITEYNEANLEGGKNNGYNPNDNGRNNEILRQFAGKYSNEEGRREVHGQILAENKNDTGKSRISSGSRSVFERLSREKGKEIVYNSTGSRVYAINRVNDISEYTSSTNKAIELYKILGMSADDIVVIDGAIYRRIRGKAC